MRASRFTLVVASEHDDHLSVFVSVRPRLFGIAYRMLRSAAEAEDIVQDVWLRWQSTNRSVVENPQAFLKTTATRLCINLIQSAHSRHETCIGAWQPELVDTGGDPQIGAERDEAVRLALLTLVERLSPTERAVYLLREGFDYSYRQIAHILQTNEANTRQLVSRARNHLAEDRHTLSGPNKGSRLLEAFVAAAQGGDMADLETLLTEDVHCSDVGRGDSRNRTEALRRGISEPRKLSAISHSGQSSSIRHASRAAVA